MRTAVYPGSFDPVTYGHLDIISRAAAMFDELVVAVVRNPGKNSLFSLEEREEMLRECLNGLHNVRTAVFSGLLVNFLRESGTGIVVRGLRSVADFENEMQMAAVNRTLLPGMETVFLAADSCRTFISSSAVREISALGGDVSAFVPVCVLKKLQVKYGSLV